MSADCAVDSSFNGKQWSCVIIPSDRLGSYASNSQPVSNLRQIRWSKYRHWDRSTKGVIRMSHYQKVGMVTGVGRDYVRNSNGYAFDTINGSVPTVNTFWHVYIHPWLMTPDDNIIADATIRFQFVITMYCMFYDKRHLPEGHDALAEEPTP